jgi:hypothetical protein
VVRVPGYRSRGPGLDSRSYQIFWEVVGLELGPLSLTSTTEELLGRNSSGSGLKNREYGRGDPLRWPSDTLNPQKLALTSPKCGGRSVGIVRFRTKTTEFVLNTNWPIPGWIPVCAGPRSLSAKWKITEKLTCSLPLYVVQNFSYITQRRALRTFILMPTSKLHILPIITRIYLQYAYLKYVNVNKCKVVSMLK